MEFAAWLTANGYDETKLNEKQRAHLTAAWKAETAPPPVKEKTTEPKTEWEVEVAKAKANAARTEAIMAFAGEAVKKASGNSHKINRIESLCSAAVADEKCTIESFRLQMLQEDRSTGLIVSTPQTPQVNSDVLEAAICVTYKLPDVEKKFSDQTLQAAHDKFRHGVSLKRLLTLGARANGFRGEDTDPFTLAKQSMRSRETDEYGMRADTGISTGIQVPGILSNIANKFIAPSFNFTEQTWRQIAKVSPVSNFQTKTTYRFAGANTYKIVPPGGEIRHGSATELSYTISAETFGIMLGVSRNDMINDDLGAFVNMSQSIGAGAGEVLNNVFWTAWLDDSNFFNTDGSKLNYDAGATDSVLSLAGLENANQLFLNQTKPDGTPLGADPRILLVPTSLWATAKTLMGSAFTNVATSSVALTGNTNIWDGMFQVASSRYLSKTSIPDKNGVSQTVTGSSTAWYLLADPNNIAAIEVAFLFGKEMPTVESSEFEFDRLGISTRAYFDFGVSKMEYRAACKLKGAA